MMTRGTDPEVKTETRSQVTKTVTVNLLDLIEIGIEGLQKRIGDAIPLGKGVVEVSIPGGGDYSNTSLEAEELEAVITWQWEEGENT